MYYENLVVLVNDKQYTDTEREYIAKYLEELIPDLPFTLKTKEHLGFLFSAAMRIEQMDDEDCIIFRVYSIIHTIHDKTTLIVFQNKNCV